VTLAGLLDPAVTLTRLAARQQASGEAQLCGGSLTASMKLVAKQSAARQLVHRKPKYDRGESWQRIAHVLDIELNLVLRHDDFLLVNLCLFPAR
jgi:hypothetical protein